MATEYRDRFIKHIFTIVAPHMDALSRGFSLGMDRFWRSKATELSGIKKGDHVLDICSGTGELAFRILPLVGNKGSVTGIDFCERMLEIARKKAGNAHSNLSFILADAKKLPFPDGYFDAVTVAFGMRNIPDTIPALKEIYRVLKPDGKFICLELTRPENGWFLRLYRWYLVRFMPFVSNFVLKSTAPYLYLPQSIEAFYRPKEFQEVIAQNGFSNVSVHSLTCGVATIYRGYKHG